MKITTLDDYIDDIHAKFPTISKSILKKICIYGFRMFHLTERWGACSFITNRNPDFKLYTGKFKHGQDAWAKYKIIQNSLKVRIKNKLKKTTWNGYYYLGLSESQWKYYKDRYSIRKRGKKTITFKNVNIYKLEDEIKYYHGFKCIFRFKMPIECGYIIKNESITIKNPELYLMRNNQTKKWEPVSYEERK